MQVGKQWKWIKSKKEGDIDFGHVLEAQFWLGSGSEELLDGDNRKNFLRGENPHVLHFWQLKHENDLLSHSLAKLNDNAKVD